MKRTLTLLIVCIAASIIFSACSSSRWVRTPVIKNRDLIVTLEQHQVEGKIVSQVYKHPCDLTLPEVGNFLGDLTYIEEVGLMGKEKEMPVFQKLEIVRLAPVLVETLGKADDSQRIRFTSHNRGKGLIFSVPRKTEGVVFVTPENRFNIAFNYINREININETTQFPEDFSNKDPLTIQHADTVIANPPPYAEIQVLKEGEPSPMWVAADLYKLKQSTEKPEIPVQSTAEPTPRPITETAPETSEPDHHEQTARQGEKIALPASTEPEAAKATPAPAIDKMLQKDIKHKLQYLKELLDEGLITQQDYDAKKMELLDKIE